MPQSSQVESRLHASLLPLALVSALKLLAKPNVNLSRNSSSWLHDAVEAARPNLADGSVFGASVSAPPVPTPCANLDRRHSGAAMWRD